MGLGVLDVLVLRVAIVEDLELQSGVGRVAGAGVVDAEAVVGGGGEEKIEFEDVGG